MKAKSLGLLAEDYTTGKVRHVDRLYTGTALLGGAPGRGDRAAARRAALACPSPSSQDRGALLPNQYLVMRNGSLSALAHHNRQAGTLERVSKRTAYGVEPRNAEQIFALDALMRPEVQLAHADRARRHRQDAAGAGRGARAAPALPPDLPGPARGAARATGTSASCRATSRASSTPTCSRCGTTSPSSATASRPRARSTKALSEMIEHEKIEIAPLAYIRGRSLDHVFFIVDEAQNLTPHEVKTIITRAGEGSKVVFTGDIHQIDTPYLDSQSNGLTVLIDRMKEQELFAHVNLVKGERSHLAELASTLL